MGWGTAFEDKAPSRVCKSRHRAVQATRFSPHGGRGGGRGSMSSETHAVAERYHASGLGEGHRFAVMNTPIV